MQMHDVDVVAFDARCGGDCDKLRPCVVFAIVMRVACTDGQMSHQPLLPLLLSFTCDQQPDLVA